MVPARPWRAAPGSGPGHPLGQAGAYTLDMVDGTGHVRAIPGAITGGSTFTVRTTPST